MFQNSFVRRSRDISMTFKFGELLGNHCSFSSIIGQFS